ncbi:MAG: aspartate dehydrogenase [Pseudomonadota bacterium]
MNRHDGDIHSRANLRVGIGGFGAIGQAVAVGLGSIDGLALSAISARRLDRAGEVANALRVDVPVVAAQDLVHHADVIVECAPATAYADIVEPAVEAGRVVISVSVGALLERMDLVETARSTGARIQVPSGAILGLDALRAAKLGTIDSVTMVTRKPPSGLQGVAYLEGQGIDVMAIREPTQVFAGSAAEGARHFPANVNVAAAVGLAGLGPERTTLEVWVDPTINRNMHTVVVEADAVRFKVDIENVPSTENPRTGRLVAPSVLSSLERLVAPLVVGT